MADILTQIEDFLKETTSDTSSDDDDRNANGEQMVTNLFEECSLDQVELMTSRLVHQIRIKLNEIDIEKLEVNKRTQIVGDIRKLFAKHISFVQCVVELLIHPFL